MRRFVTVLCLSLTLFSVGVSVVMPNVAVAQTYQNDTTGSGTTANGTVDFGDNKSFDPYSVCSGWLSIGCSFSIAIVYGMWFRFTHFLAVGSAYLADQVLFLSLQSSTYRGGDMMTQGWIAVRDFVNIGFIIALLYVGFQFISNNSKSRSILVKIIVSALLVNFSLFGARFIIDMGNIVARSIYTHIKIENTTTANVQAANDRGQSAGRISVSEAILEATNPQQILFAEYQNQSADSNSFFWTMLVIFFMTGLLNIFLIIMFASMAILFISRTVGLIMLAIIVPISIVADLIDPVKKAVSSSAGKFAKLLSFESWLDEFAKLSATAPIYVFFLYIILMLKSSLINSKTATVGLDGTAEQVGIMITVVKAMMPTVIIFFFLRMASKMTQDLAGTMGGVISDGVTKAVGFVGGMALGAVGGLAARAGGGIAKARYGDLAGMTEDERKAKEEEAKAKLVGANRLNPFARYEANKYSQKNQNQAHERLNYLTKEASYDARNIANTRLFNQIGGKQFMAMAGDGQKFASVDYGKADSRSYNTRKSDRAKKAGEDYDYNKKLADQALQDKADEDKKKLLREMNDPKISGPRRKVIEDRIAEMDGGLNTNMSPADQQAREQTIRREEQRKTAAENRLQQQERLAQAQESAGNATGAAVTRSNMASIRATIVDAENNRQRALLGGPSVSDRESTIATLNNNTSGQGDPGLSQLEANLKQLQAVQPPSARNMGEIKKTFKAIQERKAQIAQANKDLEKAKFDAKNRTGDGVAKLKSDITSDESAIKAKEREILAKEAEENDAKIAGKTQDEIKKIQGEKGKLTAAKAKLEKEKSTKEDAIKAREEKKKELEESLQSGKFLTDDATAESHGKTYRELKEKYAREVDPDRRADLMRQMQWQNELIKEGYTGTRPAQPPMGASADEMAVYQSQMRSYTTNKTYFDMSMQKQLIEQVKQNQAVFGTALAVSMEEHMKNAWGKMGKTLEDTVIAAVGAPLAGVLTTAIVGGLGAVTAPVSAVAATALAGAVSVIAPEMASNLYTSFQNTAINAAGYGTSTNQEIIDLFRRNGAGKGLPGYNL